MNLWDVKKGRWNERLLQMTAGSTDTLDLKCKLGDVPEDGGCNLGNVSSYFVDRFGFNPACIIAPFTGDNPSTILALPLRPMDAIVSLGTSTTFLMSTPHYKPDPAVHFFNHPTTAGLYMFMLCYKNGIPATPTPLPNIPHNLTSRRRPRTRANPRLPFPPKLFPLPHPRPLAPIQPPRDHPPPTQPTHPYLPPKTRPLLPPPRNRPQRPRRHLPLHLFPPDPHPHPHPLSLEPPNRRPPQHTRIPTPLPPPPQPLHPRAPVPQPVRSPRATPPYLPRWRRQCQPRYCAVSGGDLGRGGGRV